MKLPRWIEFQTIYGVDGEHRTPYMTRLCIGRLRLHIFHRGDNDPDPHDHPWAFWTFPLTSYVEEVHRPFAGGRLQIERRVVRRLRRHYRPATYTHRVIAPWAGRFVPARLSDGTVDMSPVTCEGKIITLVWRNRGNRPWGFWKACADGVRQFVPWRRYVFEDGKHAPCEPPQGASS